MATDITQILLRDTTQAPFTNNAAPLTYAEMDANLITLGLFSYEMQAAIDVDAYDAGTTYNTGDRVKYDSALWEWIQVASGSGVTPDSNPLIWERITIGTIIHEKNKDSQLVNAGGDVVTADDILAFTGLSFDFTLDGSAGNGAVGYLDLVEPADGTVVDELTLMAIAADLAYSGSLPSVELVLHDGTPANDVSLGYVVTVNELNAAKKSKQDLTPVAKTAGFSVKLKITGSNITAGTLKVKVNYV